MRLRRTTARIALLLAVLSAPACEEDSPTQSDVPSSQLDLAVDPNPIVAVQNTLTGTVTIAYRAVITEIAGLGGEVVFLNSTVFDPETGRQVAQNYYDATDLIVFVGSKRIEGGQSLVVPQTLTYILPDLRKEADVAIAVQFKDDRDNLQTLSILVKAG